MSTTLTDERTAIESTVQLYIDGASKGDAAKLEEAFNEGAWMYGSLGGQRMDMPITEMTAFVAEKPLGGNARITSVEQVGDAAVVRVEEDGCWGTVSFVDWFTLAKIDGTWKIASKLFAHTGGEMPAG
jgi:Putative lumazine-binding